MGLVAMHGPDCDDSIAVLTCVDYIGTVWVPLQLSGEISSTSTGNCPSALVCTTATIPRLFIILYFRYCHPDDTVFCANDSDTPYSAYTPLLMNVLQILQLFLTRSFRNLRKDSLRDFLRDFPRDMGLSSAFAISKMCQ